MTFFLIIIMIKLFKLLYNNVKYAKIFLYSKYLVNYMLVLF